MDINEVINKENAIKEEMRAWYTFISVSVGGLNCIYYANILILKNGTLSMEMSLIFWFKATCVVKNMDGTNKYAEVSLFWLSNKTNK